MNREQYLKLIEPALLLQVQKSSDYKSVHDYFPFGHQSYVQMLHVKTHRLVSIVGKPNDVVTNESVKDSVLDLVNYAVFYLEFLEMQEKERRAYEEQSKLQNIANNQYVNPARGLGQESSSVFESFNQMLRGGAPK